MKKKIILDTDPGIDDLLAIMLAQRSSECELLGVTTVSGNCHVNDGTRHALAVRRLLDALELPICMGCHRPLTRSLRTQKYFFTVEETIPVPPDPDWRAQVNSRHAVNFLLEQVNRFPGEISLFPLAPLTNIATALIMDDSFAGKVKEIILMGGAARVPGNTFPTVEFNFMVDPEAARLVFEAGIPITMVGLDVTGDAALLPEDSAALERVNTPISCFVRDLTRHYLDAGRNCILFDPLAVAVGLQPSLLLDAPEAFVSIDTAGEFTAGTSVCDFQGLLRRPPNAKVAARVDVDGFMRLFWERVVGIKEWK